ncbi:MAG: epimerase, partial [Myxococcota bacterium]|nr:epimerase [Myxococcota bacterium]
MNHHAFVAGATGYTGRAVVATLRDQGVRTTAHVRPGSPRLDTHRDHFESLGAAVDTTPWSQEAMAATLSTLHPTLVFCLLGTTRHRVAQERRAGDPALTYDDVDYGM